MDEPKSNPPQHRKYKWPWFVLAAFILAIVLAVIWMSAEIRRQESYRQLNTPEFPQGNSTNSGR